MNLESYFPVSQEEEIIMWPCTECHEFNDNTSDTCSKCQASRAAGRKKIQEKLTSRFDDSSVKVIAGMRKAVSPNAASQINQKPKVVQLEETIEEAQRAKFRNGEFMTDFTKTLEEQRIAEVRREFGDVEKYKILQTGYDMQGRKVIAFFACNLPSKGKLNRPNFLKYINYILKHVGEDYVIVYFNAGISGSYLSTFTWLKEAYGSFDRAYKKSLKALYVVHPTKMTRVLLKFIKPFLSEKFEGKIEYVFYLNELKDLLHLDKLSVPQSVLEYDAMAMVARTDAVAQNTRQFSVALQDLKEKSGRNIPVVVEQTIDYLMHHGLKVEGIFRKSAPRTEVGEIMERYDRGETVDFNIDDYKIHTPAVILKTFLGKLPEPILTFDLLGPVTKLHTVDSSAQVLETERLLRVELPEDNYIILKYIIRFLKEVKTHSDENKMTAENLAIVFGVNLLWSRGHKRDTPSTISSFNHFALLLIKHFDEVFKK